eukprot:scaffold73740_cov39-Cyclotella_meneghiniana.AAC.2
MTTRGDFAVGLFADGFNYLFHVHHNTINQARAVMFVCVSAMLRSSSSRQITTNSRQTHDIARCTLHHTESHDISRQCSRLLTTPHDISRQCLRLLATTHDMPHDNAHDILTTILHDNSRQLTTCLSQN